MSFNLMPLLLVLVLFYLAAFGLSIAALVQIHRGRGRYTGKALAGVTLVTCCMLLLVGPAILWAGLEARPMNRPRSADLLSAELAAMEEPSGPRFDQDWLTSEDLPDGFTFREQHAGSEAIGAARLPVRLAEDIEDARYLVLAPGGIELLGLRFKSEPLIELWGAAPELRVGGRWVKSLQLPRGFVLFGSGQFSGNGPSPEAVWAAYRKKTGTR